MRNQRDVFESNRSIDFGDNVLEIPTQRWLAARERHQHRIEESGGVGEALQFRRASARVGFPIVTERATSIAAKRDLEMHEHRPTPRREPGIFAEKERDVPWLESRGEH